MLTCKELAQQHASDYLDKQLSGKLSWNVRIHLMICSRCRQFITRLKIVRGVIKLNTEAIEETQVQATTARLYATYHEQKKPLPPDHPL